MNAEPRCPPDQQTSTARERRAAHTMRACLAKALPVLAVSWIGLMPNSAEAYIGPGAGLSAIGSLLALLGAVLLIIVGFVWYPVRRMVRKWKAAHADQDDTEAENPAAE